jgi:hypothetical protein
VVLPQQALLLMFKLSHAPAKKNPSENAQTWFRLKVG